MTRSEHSKWPRNKSNGRRATSSVDDELPAGQPTSPGQAPSFPLLVPFLLPWHHRLHELLFVDLARLEVARGEGDPHDGQH